MKKVIAVLTLVVLIVSALYGCSGSKKKDDTPPASESKTTEGNDTKKDTKEEGNKVVQEGSAEATPAPIDEAAAQALLFPEEVVNDNPGIGGGTLQVALVASSAFAGVLNPCFYEDNYDNQIISWFTEPIISYDENFVADQDGAATYEYDVANKTITLHMREGVKWQDGEPVTLDDLVFAYEVICHKDYQGIRYGE